MSFLIFIRGLSKIYCIFMNINIIQLNGDQLRFGIFVYKNLTCFSLVVSQDHTQRSSLVLVKWGIRVLATFLSHP